MWIKRVTVASANPSGHLRGILRAVGLTFLMVVIWCWQNHRGTLSSWSLPLDYTGDSLQHLARIKATSEGDLMPFGAHHVRRLAAPFVADWSQFPASDDIANYLCGLIARLTGVMAAGNLALLLAQLSAGWSFYFCARLLRNRWEWSMAGALLFGLSFFSLERGLPHLWLAFTYTVPLALLSCWLVAAGRRTTKRSMWRWLCYGTAGALGASYPYNLFLYLQLLGWSVLVRWWRERWSPSVRLGLVCGLVAVGVCGAVNSHVFSTGEVGGGPSLLVRNYAATEIYALKPIELFVPPSAHHGGWLAALGYRYLRWSDWRGEAFSPYLGLAGAIGLVWLLGAFVRDVIVERRVRRSGYALAASWILLFSVIGGPNSILAFFLRFDVFRASNRYSIFLLALGLLFVASRLSRLTRDWRSGVRLGLAGLVVIVGLWDQLPVRKSLDAVQQIKEQVRGDQRLGEEMERRLGPGAMVFQLPVLDFPEGRPQFQANEYDNLRLYIATRTLRFSYGEIKNRARDAWQHDCREMAPAALVKALESYGFAALCIDRRGYPDEAGQLLADLAETGRTALFSEPFAAKSVVLLHPAAHLVPPFARSFTYGEGWNRLMFADEVLSPVSLSPPRPKKPGPVRGPLPPLAEGSTRALRWTDGSASLSYFNPLPRALTASLDLQLSSVGERTVLLLVNGHELNQVRLGSETKEISLAAVELQPGVNRLDLITPEPAIRVSEQRLHLRAIAVHEMKMRLPSAPTVELTGDPGGER